MPGVFGDENMSNHCLGRQAALDQPFRCRGLDHRLLTGSAGVSGTVCHDNSVLRGDYIETLRTVLADHMHGRAATGAVGIVRFDRYFDPWQMNRKRATIGTPLSRPRLCSCRVALVVFGFVRGNGLLDVLDRQKQLIGIKLLRAAAELRPLQLLQQMP